MGLVVVRRITAADGELLRDVRLRALQDTPSAFGSTYAAEAARPDAMWDERAAGGARGADRCTLLAFDGEECIGLAGGFRNDEDGHHADIDLVSMWVALAYRGTGAAEQLVDAVLEWARDEAAAEVVGLWVTRGNARAQRFYERLGFVETGDVQPLPSDPCKDEVRMVFGLRAPSSAAD
ncbi:MAG TPA: GNAT family N-acetyltransferase [Mycobacteriales bacterium]|jgi:GNAT superfamily N-acetyltransferase|nr:GNAT family N-acetyltransferase [Mycobacteriales bacterium]